MDFRNLVICFYLFSCVGCAAVVSEERSLSRPEGYLNTSNIKSGLSPEEVANLVGSKVRVGFEKASDGQWSNVEIKNPQRAKVITKKGISYEVVYYLANTVHFDGEITDEEMMPFVFQGNKLQGFGWDYFHKNFSD